MRMRMLLKKHIRQHCSGPHGHFTFVISGSYCLASELMKRFPTVLHSTTSAALRMSLLMDTMTRELVMSLQVFLTPSSLKKISQRDGDLGRYYEILDLNCHPHKAVPHHQHDVEAADPVLCHGPPAMKTFRLEYVSVLAW